jgi:hypothetical protein
MPWAKVDDQWWCHQKVIGLSAAARGVWISALSWSCAQRSEIVPDGLLPMICGSNLEAKELVDVCLWEPVEGGWLIHDWHDYQGLSLSEKRAEAGRKGGLRSRPPGSKSEANEVASGSNEQASAEAGSRPDPTQPNPTQDPTQTDPSPELASANGSTPPPMASANIRSVFAVWLEATGKHPTRTQLSPKRQRLIRNALKSYPLEDVTAAVRGWRHSAFHRGENDGGKPYHDLELLLRDAQHIEKFRDLELTGAEDAYYDPAAYGD